MRTDVVGKTFPVRELRVEERLSIPNFARVIGDDDPVFYRRAAAQAAGYGDRPLPPTLLMFLHALTEEELVQDLGVRYGKTLFAGFDWEFHRVAHEGETLYGQVRVAENYVKQTGGGGRIFLVLETRFWDRRDEPVVTMHTTFMERQEDQE
jgi:hypothetical protein